MLNQKRHRCINEFFHSSSNTCMIFINRFALFSTFSKKLLPMARIHEDENEEYYCLKIKSSSVTLGKLVKTVFHNFTSFINFTIDIQNQNSDGDKGV